MRGDKPMTKNNQNRQKGVALMLSLVLLLLITAIAFGVIGMSNTENSINTNFKSEETEYFAARAGVEEGRNRILSNATDQNGASIALTAATLPQDVPDNGGKIVYILNGTKADGTPVTLADVRTRGRRTSTMSFAMTFRRRARWGSPTFRTMCAVPIRCPRRPSRPRPALLLMPWTTNGSAL